MLVCAKTLYSWTARLVIGSSGDGTCILGLSPSAVSPRSTEAAVTHFVCTSNVT